MLSVGTLLQNDQYLIDEVLSQNGNYTLYVANRAPLLQRIVLKTHPLLASDNQDFEAQRELFLAEGCRLTQIEHPHLVPVSDCFMEAGHAFIAMEFIEGQTLAQKMAQTMEQGPLPESEALHYIRQIGSGLTVLHSQGLLHRDVKPSNIIISAKSQKATLVNFGGVGQFPLDPALVDGDNGNGFAPPEQYTESHSKTAATDVYSLAATLYALTTGQAPPVAILRDRDTIGLRIPLIPPHELNPNLSPQTGQAILTGMALSLQDRPPTIDTWLALLPNLDLSADFPGHSKQESTDLDISETHPSETHPSETSLPVSNPVKHPSSSQPSETASMPTPKHPVVQPRSTPKHIFASGAPSSRFPRRALLLSAAIAGLGGAGFGFYLRTQLFSPLLSPAQSPFSTPKEKIEESFPPKARSKIYDTPTSETIPNTQTPNPIDTLDLPETKPTPPIDETAPTNLPNSLPSNSSPIRPDRPLPSKTPIPPQVRTTPTPQSQTPSSEDDLSPPTNLDPSQNPIEESQPPENQDLSIEPPQNPPPRDPFSPP